MLFSFQIIIFKKIEVLAEKLCMYCCEDVNGYFSGCMGDSSRDWLLWSLSFRKLPVKIVCLLLSQLFIVMHCQSLQLLQGKKARIRQISRLSSVCLLLIKQNFHEPTSEIPHHEVTFPGYFQVFRSFPMVHIGHRPCVFVKMVLSQC